MARQYSHLSLFERQRLFVWYYHEKRSIREIGRRLGRAHSTISREIKRNIYEYYVPTYYPKIAHAFYTSRMRKRVSRSKLENNKIRQFVVQKLKDGWTPQIIAGRLKHENKLGYVCHESIYQYIYKCAPELICYLPRKHKKRRMKYPKRSYTQKKSLKTSILERPEQINERAEFGHWESDSIESKCRKQALNVVIERVSRLTHITKLTSKQADSTASAIKRKLSKHPPDMIKSITYDNGPENAEHINVSKKLKCASYFCQPYHSWEKGSVEQVNGLIRRYLPKGTHFQNISHQKISAIERALNSRPRKCLGYKTPYEVYNEKCGAL